MKPLILIVLMTISSFSYSQDNPTFRIGTEKNRNQFIDNCIKHNYDFKVISFYEYIVTIDKYKTQHYWFDANQNLVKSEIKITGDAGILMGYCKDFIEAGIKVQNVRFDCIDSCKIIFCFDSDDFRQ
jgi:hypothetical protein